MEGDAPLPEEADRGPGAAAFVGADYLDGHGFIRPAGFLILSR
jgi:hypothetical protein